MRAEETPPELSPCPQNPGPHCLGLLSLWGTNGKLEESGGLVNRHFWDPQPGAPGIPRLQRPLVWLEENVL